MELLLLLSLKQGAEVLGYISRPLDPGLLHSRMPVQPLRDLQRSHNRAGQCLPDALRFQQILYRHMREVFERPVLGK